MSYSQKYLNKPRIPKAPMKYQLIEEIQEASSDPKSMPRCISCLNRSVNGKGTRAVRKPENVYDTQL